MVKINNIIEKLRSSGLRPTKQRVQISRALFETEKTFHFTIENLKTMIERNFQEKISLATLYNTVHAFKKKGYIKEIPLKGNKTYYDTNIKRHHHFFDEDNQTLSDISEDVVKINKIPKCPVNKKIKNIEILIRVETDNLNQKK